MSDLYKRIEDLCKSRGETITEMCRASGASRGSLTDLKSGRLETLSQKTLQKISGHLNVTVDALLTGRQKEKPTGQDADGLKNEICDLYEALPQAERREAIAFLKGLLASHKDGSDRQG